MWPIVMPERYSSHIIQEHERFWTFCTRTQQSHSQTHTHTQAHSYIMNTTQIQFTFTASFEFALKSIQKSKIRSRFGSPVVCTCDMVVEVIEISSHIDESDDDTMNPIPYRMPIGTRTTSSHTMAIFK